MSNCSTCPSKDNCGKDETSCGIENNPNNKIKHVIAVMSGKGGVGKSSMTVLLAKAYAALGFDVGIMDADITGPSIPRLLGLSQQKAFGVDKAIQPVVDKDGIKSMSINYLVDGEDTPVIWRGPIVGNAVKQFWTDVIWGELDVLFIDMPPGTGDVALTIMQSMPVSGVVMVSTPQPMVSMIVSKAVNMLNQMNIPVLGVIENMSYIECPKCNEKIDLYDTNDTKQFIENTKLKLLGELPMIRGISNIHKDEDLEASEQSRIRDLVFPIAEELIKTLK